MYITVTRSFSRFVHQSIILINIICRTNKFRARKQTKSPGREKSWEKYLRNSKTKLNKKPIIIAVIRAVCSVGISNYKYRA